MTDRVRITDVSPRDGLQNEPGAIPTADKVRLVNLLAATGVDEVEVTSFVSAKWVPQLGDAAEVIAGMTAAKQARDTAADTAPLYAALVPNEKGLDAALQANAAAGFPIIGKVSVFTAASETFSRKNTNASIAETIERFRPVVARAHAAGLLVRGYISCIIACPFEGAIDPAAVAAVARSLIELGVDEIDLGDTIGAGDAASMKRLLTTYTTTHKNDPTPITIHLHDTFNRAAECVIASLDHGVRSFDGSVAGLGGCPYASTPGRRAPGNIATDLLVRTIHNAGYTTGVDLDTLAQAAAFAQSTVTAARIAHANASNAEEGDPQHNQPGAPQ